MEGPQVDEGSMGGNQSRASLRGGRRQERERRRKQQMQDEHETRLDSDEGFSHRQRTVSYNPKQPHRSDRLRELENL
nr:hypothetical protein CFP56_12686 [Quercus suber]